MSSIRGWMIDAARLPEPLAYYRRVIDQCAEWGINTILFRLTDDQGSALRFSCHPELETHVHAYTPQELSGLAEYAAHKSVDLIPEIESFGHTGFITRCPAHSHLLDEDLQEHTNFTGIIPHHPDTLALLADLYQEISQIFSSAYLHAGCDEVNWGGSAYSRHLIAAKGKAAVWASYINLLLEIARQNDRQLMIWADHPLYGSPEILPLLDRDIILIDWNYWETDPQAVHDRVETAMKSGFRMLGSPAWIWCRWSVRPGQAQLDNMDALSAVYARIQDPANLGTIVTNWAPSRYLNRALWDGLAFTAQINTRPEVDRLHVWRAFVERHYHSDWTPDWGDLYPSLYTFIPPRQACARGLPGPYQPEAWHDPDSLARVLRQQPADLHPLAELLARAQRCESLVKHNPLDFQAVIHSIEYLSHLQNRHAAVFQLTQLEDLGSSQVVAALEAVAAADEKLEKNLREDWFHSRFQDDPAQDTLLPRLEPHDQSLYAMQQAAAFSRSLAEQPARFRQIVDNSRSEL